jgi:hypothetical protein
MRGIEFIDVRRRIQALREELAVEIATTFPTEVKIIRPGGRRRTQLWIRNLQVSVLVARSLRVRKNAIRWLIEPVLDELENVTLLVQMDEQNESIRSLHLLPGIDREKRFHIGLNDTWLERGIRLLDVRQFCDLAEAAASMQARSASFTVPA